MRCIPTILFLSIFLAGVPPAGAEPVDSRGDLSSQLPMEVTGTAELAGEHGALRVEPEAALDHIRLRAERITVDHAWERGFDIDTTAARTTYIVDRGDEHIVLDDAKVRMGSLGGPPLMVAFTEENPASLTLSSTGKATLAPDEDVPVVGVGTPPDSVDVGDAPKLGFWHVVEGTSVQGHATGLVRIEGSFSLFVHNASLQITGQEASWKESTGYWESNPGGPINEIELRITVLRIQNGSLLIPSSYPVAYALQSMSGNLDGSIAFPSVSGSFRSAGGLLTLDAQSLMLTGRGSVTVKPSVTASGTPQIAVTSEGSFVALASAAGIEAEGARGSSDWPLGSLLSIGGLFLVAFAAGATELGVLPGPTTALQRRRFERWMRRGHRAAERGRWAFAAWCYKKATRANHLDALAWYDRAYAELEAGHWHAAEAVAVEAADAPGIDSLDLIEVRAAAAWELKDHEAFAAHVMALAAESPKMARGLVQDLAIEDDSLSASVLDLLRPAAREDGIDGYG